MSAVKDKRDWEWKDYTQRETERLKCDDYKELEIKLAAAELKIEQAEARCKEMQKVVDSARGMYSFLQNNDIHCEIAFEEAIDALDKYDKQQGV